MAENVKDSSSSPQRPPWIELPLDLTANILHRLNTEAIMVNAQKVCTTWRKVCLEPIMWRVVDLECRDRDKDEKYCIMCCCAVDRSRGKLIELRISGFGDGKLLDYIANRASNLKCLTLQRCIKICGIHLTQAIKKLPNLEELHMTDMPFVYAVDVLPIGLNCPKLRSFSFNPPSSIVKDLDDELHRYDCALAISGSMPNLRHLRYGTRYIQDKELEAILDGCPHLESLNLMECYVHFLGDDLAKRCLEQINDLRIPFVLPNDIGDLSDVLSGLDDPPFDY